MSKKFEPSAASLQDGVQVSAPSGDVGALTDRGPNGRFAKGNRAALVTSARSRVFWEAVATERARLRGELLAARGFASEVDTPAAMRLVADGASQACLLRDATFECLVESGGPMTAGGRTRRVLAVWQSAADRALKHLQAIGLERVERDVTSPLDRVRAAVLEANRA